MSDFIFQLHLIFDYFKCIYLTTLVISLTQQFIRVFTLSQVVYIFYFINIINTSFISMLCNAGMFIPNWHQTNIHFHCVYIRTMFTAFIIPSPTFNLILTWFEAIFIDIWVLLKPKTPIEDVIINVRYLHDTWVT